MIAGAGVAVGEGVGVITGVAEGVTGGLGGSVGVDVALGIGDGVRAGTLAVGNGDAGGALDEFGPTKGLALPLQAFTVRNEATDMSPKKKRRITHLRNGPASIEFIKRR